MSAIVTLSPIQYFPVLCDFRRSSIATKPMEIVQLKMKSLKLVLERKNYFCKDIRIS